MVKVSSSSLEVATEFVGLEKGESVSVNGVCLTVAEVGDGRFTADLSEETVKRTNLASLQPGSRVNLERAVMAGARLGGHIVQGHIDAVGRIEKVEDTGNGRRIWMQTPEFLAHYLVEKGSVGVDGVSLTISALEPGRFAVDLIPVTLERTSFGDLDVGDSVNLEADVIAKYVESILLTRASPQ